MQKKNDKGITLVALVITIILLLILTGVAIKVVVGEGVLNKAEETVNKVNQKTAKENSLKENMEEEWNKKPEGIKSGTWNPIEELVDTRIEINAIVSAYNESLGSFPTVYSLVGKLNEEIVYEDITFINSSSAGTARTYLNAYLPAKTEITVTEVYSGASYSLTTENKLKRVVQKESEESNKAELVFNFSHEYNNGNRGNAVGMVTSDEYISSIKNSVELNGYILASNSNNYSNNIKRVVAGRGWIRDKTRDFYRNSTRNIQQSRNEGTKYIRI